MSLTFGRLLKERAQWDTPKWSIRAWPSLLSYVSVNAPNSHQAAPSPASAGRLLRKKQRKVGWDLRMNKKSRHVHLERGLEHMIFPSKKLGWASVRVS